MATKICTKCKTEKDTTDFFARTKAKDGLNSACKSCCNDRTANSRRAKMGQYNGAKVKYRRKQKQKFLEWKSAKGCHFCSETFPQCLELHHLDPSQKDFVPSQLTTGNWDRFMEEAKKCILVCANCHRKIHYGAITVDCTVQYIFD